MISADLWIKICYALSLPLFEMNLFLTSKMSSRLQEKFYGYALFYLSESNQLGMAQTSIVAEAPNLLSKINLYFT